MADGASLEGASLSVNRASFARGQVTATRHTDKLGAVLNTVTAAKSYFHHIHVIGFM